MTRSTIGAGRKRPASASESSARPGTTPVDARPSWVVIPARDEAADLPACLAALRVAARRAPGPVRVVVVDDGSTDATTEIARATFAEWRSKAALRPGDAAVRGFVIQGRAAGVGWARRVGIEHAMCEARRAAQRRPVRRRAAGGAGVGGTVPGSANPLATALIATTDADSRVAPTWLAVLHARLDDGHGVIAGDVHLDPSCDPRLVAARATRLAARVAALPEDEAAAPHPHFAGSNLAFAIETLAALGPLPTPRALEDQAVLERCRELRIPVLRDHEAIVVTSARTEGRAELGLAAALTADLHALEAA